MGRAAVRRAVLVLHITTSVGWLGGVVSSVALAALAIAADGARSAAVYLVLEPLGWIVLVPLGVASLATGVTQSLITVWGLVRHYWVLIKLLLNLFAVTVLLLYMRTLAVLADAAKAVVDNGPPMPGSASPLIHAVGAVVLLLVAVVLSVYKPRGLTPAGDRRRRASQAGRRAG